MKVLIIVVLTAFLLFLVSCDKKKQYREFVAVEVEKPLLEPEPDFSNKKTASAAPEGETELERGKRIWTTVCIQCHNKDPNVKGSIGPETVDAPLEVLHAKVMTGRYPDPLPPGFVPKRDTKLMRSLPQYENDTKAIWVYIQSVKK